MLVANNLYKNYFVKKGKLFNKVKEEKHAVRDVSLKIEKGQIVGLLGINGAGKTTTIKMLTTMISPTSGEIKIDSIDAVKNYMEAKKKINLITGGERNIYWRLTAKENLEYFGSLYGINGKQLDKRIDEILKIVDLDKQKDLPVEKYSKGMKQRLQIARGLINDPEYIFMDEPTLGLDIMITKNIHEYVKKLAYEENKGILITTHYIFEAEELCDYIYVIDDGKIVAEGTSEEIKKLYTPKKVCKFTFEDVSVIDQVIISELEEKKMEINIDEGNQVAVIKSEALDLQEILSYFTEKKIDILNIDILEASLEDALLEILGGKNSDISFSM